MGDDGDAFLGVEGLDDAADGIELDLFGRFGLAGGEEEGKGGEAGPPI
jgi:hypothetical protein